VCAVGPLAPLASTGYGDFTYLVDFTGSSGPPHTQSRVSQITSLVDDIPAYNDGECAQGIACVYSYCPTGTLPTQLVDHPAGMLEDEDIEIETRACGWPVENNTGLNIGYIWDPIIYACPPDSCGQSPTLVAENWFSNAGAAPKKIKGILTYPRYLLGTLYSSAATIRFRRKTSNLSGFDCDLTSSTLDSTSTPTVTAADCRYYHRMGTASCGDGSAPGDNCIRASGGSTYDYGYASDPPSPACAPDLCCCKSELRVRFRVVMDITEMGWATTAVNSYGPIAGTTAPVVMTVTAYYYGCTDARLYSASSTQPALRNFTLDRAAVSWVGDLTAPDRYGLGDSPTYGIPAISTGGPCFDAGRSASTSTVVADDGCGTCTGTVLDATTAISIGIPASVAVTRSTP